MVRDMHHIDHNPNSGCGYKLARIIWAEDCLEHKN